MVTWVFINILIYLRGEVVKGSGNVNEDEPGVAFLSYKEPLDLEGVHGKVHQFTPVLISGH